MVSLLCPFFHVTECAAIGVARGGTGGDTLGCSLLRMGTHKRLVAASEQSRSGDGIASAGATSGESIKRKNGGNFGFRNASFVPKPEYKNKYFIQG